MNESGTRVSASRFANEAVRVSARFRTLAYSAGRVAAAVAMQVLLAVPAPLLAADV